MAYNLQLAERIRAHLSSLPNIEEKKMMGGLVFMYNEKMCVGIMKDDLMCRIDPNLHENLIKKPGCRTMELGGKQMKGYIVINENGLKHNDDFLYWLQLALDFNPFAKSAKNKK